jgi:hypothetical protein
MTLTFAMARTFGIGICLVMPLAVLARAAETLTATATIESVDVTQRSISVRRKTSKGEKTGTFQVSDSAEIAVNGEAAKLDAVEKGDRVTIVYDPAEKHVVKLSVQRSSDKATDRPDGGPADPKRGRDEAGGVPSDASTFRGHSYKFFAEIVTWQEAKRHCEQMGGHLPTIANEAENKFIFDLVSKQLVKFSAFDGIWLGATDDQSEGDWRWIDGSRLTFAKWYRGEPDNASGIEDYMFMWLARSGAWTDEAESPKKATSYLVCEWDRPVRRRSSGSSAKGKAKGTASLACRTATAAEKKAAGATDASEAAVASALQWMAKHQHADGSWSFDLKQTPCDGRCSESGTEPSLTGATGLALLPFLGRGETHFEGEYQETLKRGLSFLTGQMLMTSHGGDLRGAGNMYSHGIATVVLCEAYAMTHDETLEPFAQKAVDFIVSAEHVPGGGWRYEPGMPGDTTVTGWQVMALKSGEMGYLRVPFEATVGANRFLDSVQVDRGARYSYQPRQDPVGMKTTSAVGLLCRMYLGWQRNRAELEKGAKYLAEQGPKAGNAYFNYYATQVLHQFDAPHGKLWRAWDAKLRDDLVSSQAREGHETGSWFFAGGDEGATAGGRLYCTAMTAATLEVYYRYPPLYEK